jgi:small subunit ribosomal protein S2
MVAEAYNEGAKTYQEELKKSSDKRDSEEAPVREVRETRSGKPQPAAEGGPAVFKKSKGRKLVAAGTADEAEIEMELELGETVEPEKDGDTTES